MPLSARPTMTRTKLTGRRGQVTTDQYRGTNPGCICKTTRNTPSSPQSVAPTPTLAPGPAPTRDFKRTTRSMTAAASPKPEANIVQAESLPKPMTFEEACKKIFNPDKPIQSTVADELFGIGELVENVAKNLEPHDIVRSSRINRTWYGMVQQPAKAIRLVLGRESANEVIDVTSVRDARGNYKVMETTLNPLIFHTPGDYTQECGYFRSAPIESLSPCDPRAELFICDPPVNQAIIDFELYYTAPPTIDIPARVIVICGSRYLNAAGGVRHKDVQRVFKEEASKPKGKQVSVDILRSYVAIPNMTMVGVPEIAVYEADAHDVEFVEMPNKTSTDEYQVLLDGNEISSEDAEDEGWEEDMEATHDDE